MRNPDFDFSKIQGFDWDIGNRDKNWLKHKVDYRECEEVFFNQPLFVYLDERHSQKEVRYYAMGRTHEGRTLFLSFTIRANRVRIISARHQSRKEKKWYETQAK
jgi:uncharacterized DUF497 family protein